MGESPIHRRSDQRAIIIILERNKICDKKRDYRKYSHYYKEQRVATQHIAHPSAEHTGKHHGLSAQEIGLYYGTFGAAAFVFGSLLAGYYISANGLRNTLFKLCLTFNIPFVVYAVLAYFQPTGGVIISAGIILEYFGYGFGFVGLTLFMMQQVAPGKHQMAHYAFASGIMNFGVMLPGMLSGWVCNMLGGYTLFFIVVALSPVPKARDLRGHANR